MIPITTPRTCFLILTRSKKNWDQILLPSHKHKTQHKKQMFDSSSATTGSFLVGVVHCTVLSSIYVGSLYLFKGALSSSRNDPSMIRMRTLCVIAVCIISLAYTALFDRFCVPSTTRNSMMEFLRRMGLHMNIFKHIMAIGVALLLNSLLFMGPIVHMLLSEQVLVSNVNHNSGGGGGSSLIGRYLGGFSFRYSLILDGIKSRVQPTIQFLKQYPSMLISGDVHSVDSDMFLDFRNIVVGPVSEELVFRSCMYLLTHFCGRLAPATTITVSSLIFGLAHCHHIVDHMLHGKMTIMQAVASVLVQLTYTSLFAAYNGYIFIRTGSLWASIAMHSYCNYLGLPDFGGMLSHPQHKFKFMALLSSGLILFFAFISPMTTQYVFNSVYYE